MSRFSPTLAVSVYLAAASAYATTHPLSIELQERTSHPFYYWPRTLLTYRIDFSKSGIKPDDLALIDGASRKGVPFQLSDVKSAGGVLESALVSFFSDLPSGGTRRFELISKPDSRVAPEFPVRETVEGNSIIIDSGVMKVRIPASQAPGQEVPGPILQVARAGKWFGHSKLVSPRTKVIGIETKRLESGPLFTVYRIAYRFANKGSYVATVRCQSGMEFVTLYEEMEGLLKRDDIAVESAWTEFQPTHRQAPNHPHPRADGPAKAGRYDYERIDEELIHTQRGVGRGMGENGELPFRLGAYQPWTAQVIVTSVNFWDERSNDALGFFIDRVGKWQDNEYAIWAASGTLQVRFYYAGKVLSSRAPLVTGTRSTAIATYDHRKDIETAQSLVAAVKGKKDHPDGHKYRAKMSPLSYAMFLQNRYGTLDLNMVKDWVLEYPDSKRRPPIVFKEGPLKSADEFEETLMNSELVSALPFQGTRQLGGFAPVPSRKVYSWFLDSYNRFYPTMTADQKKRITAVMLLLGYTHADEDYMPMKNMLAGHPNFLADVKGVPGVMAFLFPEHPMAREWSDEFEAYMDLNTRYHTRPPVEAWGSQGGRWTENLGTYLWAFLRPSSRTNYLLKEFGDGRNRFANPQVAWIGDWIVNSLSAPFAGEDLKFYADEDGSIDKHYWGTVTYERGPRRIHPPQGSHSARRMPPRSAWLLGKMLHLYSPMVAEHLMYVSQPIDEDAEALRNEADTWGLMFRSAANHGTNPHLKSRKYTGYGIQLRAAVDTPEELSVHLQQIDAGPNYRWGVVGEGGGGVIYYFANGKAYSHNGREDVGDRRTHDTDFATTFGVWKEGRYKSIGRNDLDRPMYDLGVAQFAEVTSRRGDEAYSWPEYRGRSVMLVGSDYISTYDDVFNDSTAGRFSWFTHPKEALPFIHIARAAGFKNIPVKRTEVKSEEVHGVWIDVSGDLMTVVTHKPDLKVENTDYGCTVKSARGVDYLFRDPAGVEFAENGIVFEGSAGVIRTSRAGQFSLAMFHGKEIGAGGVTLRTSDSDLGVSVEFRQAAELTGLFSAGKPAVLEVSWSGAAPSQSTLYIDGIKSATAWKGKSLSIALPPGSHRWQITAAEPIPMQPVMLWTGDSKGGGTVHFSKVPGATGYYVESSSDGGKTWKRLGQTTATEYAIKGIAADTKIHLRAIAFNGTHQSAPADEYPMYVTDAPPLPPDGLRTKLGAGTVELTWGEVLGVSEYRLYRRLKGEQQFSLVYKGRERSFKDFAPGVIPAHKEPGAATGGPVPGKLYEYTIASANGNGEGAKCAPINTDPASWINWDPRPGERFRRRNNYTILTEDGGQTSAYYPR